MLVNEGSALVLKVSNLLLSACLQKKQNAFRFVVQIVNQGYTLNQFSTHFLKCFYQEKARIQSSCFCVQDRELLTPDKEGT